MLESPYLVLISASTSCMRKTRTVNIPFLPERIEVVKSSEARRHVPEWKKREGIVLETDRAFRSQADWQAEIWMDEFARITHKR
jgi:hypothetical protein